MIELVKLDSTIELDIRYAREDNFLGRPVYGEARAFLQPSAAESLVNVNQLIAKDGFGLMIFDAYRPWSVTKVFWESVEPDQRKFVADPAEGSRHNRGCAVDLTLYSLETGTAVDMPSDFDEFNEKANPDYKGGSGSQRKNRDYLRNAMELNGFTVNRNEWWHFDHHDWERFEILDVPFSKIV